MEKLGIDTPETETPGGHRGGGSEGLEEVWQARG